MKNGSINDSEKDSCRKTNKKIGVSLISLVIVIIVIIILAFISLLTYQYVVGKAQFAKFNHENSEIEKLVQERRSVNQQQSLTSQEEDINKGFKKVYLNNPPPDFVSFNTDDTTGYLVDLDYINEHEILLGRQDIPGIVATFGKDDVFVYDADGRIFYLRGMNNENDEYYHRHDSKGNMTLLNEPIISNVSYQLVDDDTVALVTVHVNAAYGNNIVVMIGDQTAQPAGANTYVARLYENKPYWTLAKETDGYYTSAPINITGIKKPADKTPPVIDRLNVSYSNGAGSVDLSAHDNESKITAFALVKDGEEIEWISHNSYTLNHRFGVTETGTYTLYLKNETDLQSSQTVEVNIVHEYTISYNSNGGNGGPTNQTKRKNEAMIITSSKPSRSGYTFKGWAESSSATSALYAPGDSYINNGDATLYAVWDAKSYTITYDSNGGNSLSLTQTKEEGSNLIITSVAPQRNGYTFLGWSENSSASSPEYTAGAIYSKDQDATLYAVWREDTYTISYDSNGGSGAPSAQTKNRGQAITISSTVPSRAGYNFLGWATSASAGTAEYTGGATYSNDADLTLYAVWQALTYTISYNANGGSGAPSAQTKTHGQSITISSTKPTRTGYNFLGWATSASAGTASYNSGGTFNNDEDTTLYAVWQILVYTISYNANGGSGAPGNGTRTYGETYTIPSTIPSLEGHTFKGWDTSFPASSAKYTAGQAITENSNLTLYAVWDKINYTITYNANGGTGAPNSQQKAHGETINITSAKPTYAGYVFKGWGTSASATTVAYSAGASYSENANLTLYAIWQINATTLENGKAIAQRMKYLSGQTNPSYSTENTTITAIAWSSTPAPSGKTTSTLSLYGSVNPVVAWFDNGTIYMYSAADKVYLNADSHSMFNNLIGLTSIDMSGADTSRVTDFGYMFNKCEGLTSLALPYFDTSSATNMACMFSNCKNLKSLDISNFNTENVTSMWGMFQSCKALESLDLSNFNTSNVTRMEHMFSGLTALTSLDLSNFDTSKVTGMEYMFGYVSDGYCTNLTSLDLSSFDTRNVTNMRGMFYGCFNLPSLDLSSFDTSKVTTMSEMFYNCSKLTSLNVSSFNTSNVIRMDQMFYYCKSLPSLDITNFDTKKVTAMNTMFYGCSSLTSLDVSHLDTRSATTLGGMFADCSGLTSLDVSNFDTRNVQVFSNMFGISTGDGCKNLTSIDLSSFDTTSATNMSNMFSGCQGLTSINLESFVTSNVTNMSGMFNNCKGLTELYLNNFDTSKVNNMSKMFAGCSKLTYIDMWFDTSNVTNMEAMFKGCSGFTELYVTSFDTSKVTNMKEMFYGCSNLVRLYAEYSFVITKVYQGNYMFQYCNKIKGQNGTTYSNWGYSMARIDEGSTNPGYFSLAK